MLSATHPRHCNASHQHPHLHTSTATPALHRPHQQHLHQNRSTPHTSSHTHFQTHLSSSSLALFALVLLFATASSQQTCTDSAGCFPPIGNLALGRTIQTNSSCTENQLFCPLFLASPCSLCTANSSRNLNDNDNSTLWVSEIGPSVKEVSLMLVFERPVLFQGMTMVWQSVRPIAMALERSCDYGQTWSVYRYYALNCQVSFMMEDTFINDNTPPFNGTAAICTSVQSELFSFDFTDGLVSEN